MKNKINILDVKSRIVFTPDFFKKISQIIDEVKTEKVDCLALEKEAKEL